jgi:hypothetical protein
MKTRFEFSSPATAQELYERMMKGSGRNPNPLPNQRCYICGSECSQTVGKVPAHQFCVEIGGTIGARW